MFNVHTSFEWTRDEHIVRCLRTCVGVVLAAPKMAVILYYSNESQTELSYINFNEFIVLSNKCIYFHIKLISNINK